MVWRFSELSNPWAVASPFIQVVNLGLRTEIQEDCTVISGMTVAVGVAYRKLLCDTFKNGTRRRQHNMPVLRQLHPIPIRKRSELRSHPSFEYSSLCPSRHLYTVTYRTVVVKTCFKFFRET